jgi:hypoxanthine phosphoribosyltransferase
LAAAISADYAGKDLVLVGILRGAFVFLADLIRHLTIPVVVDFIGAASYGSRAETSGEVTITKDLQLPITGRDVLLVEDIEDTGITLQAIWNVLEGFYRPQRFHRGVRHRLCRAISLSAGYLSARGSGRPC